MNTTNGFKTHHFVSAICNPNLDTTDARTQTAIREFLNLLTVGYLDCVNLEDGTKKADISDERYRNMMSYMPQTIESVDMIVQRLSPIQLSRINEEAFATFNSIYGHYTPKGFDGKFAVKLREDLREPCMVLAKHGITPKSTMVAEFLKEVSES